ncbi:MAG: hypothetical protein K1000chlam1_00766 [Candidatus Anoxychlamydiales bacterium]|nr:hypothetical protein [Candidatus Anoxychlamydiales bacterium]
MCIPPFIRSVFGFSDYDPSNTSPRVFSSELEFAAVANDTISLLKLLKTATKEDIDNSEAICHFVVHGNFYAVEVLIEKGADLNVQVKTELGLFTPLALLVNNESITRYPKLGHFCIDQMAALLVKNGADFENVETALGQNGNVSLLVYVKNQGYEEWQKAILDRKTSID